METSCTRASISPRLKTFQSWFKETVTPELAVLHNELEKEGRIRGEADENILQVLSKYAAVMQKNFASRGGGGGGAPASDTRFMSKMSDPKTVDRLGSGAPMDGELKEMIKEEREGMHSRPGAGSSRWEFCGRR